MDNIASPSDIIVLMESSNYLTAIIASEYFLPIVIPVITSFRGRVGRGVINVGY